MLEYLSYKARGPKRFMRANDDANDLGKPVFFAEKLHTTPGAQYIMLLD